jgi:hypothetical protein
MHDCPQVTAEAFIKCFLILRDVIDDVSAAFIWNMDEIATAIRPMLTKRQSVFLVALLLIMPLVL